MPPTYDIVCHLSPSHDLYHLALPLTSLCALADHGYARVQFVSDPSSAAVPFDDPLTLSLEVSNRPAGTRSLVAIDLRDRSDVCAIQTLQRVDVYFKRSFHARDLRSLPHDLRRRVVPFGPNYACRSAASTRAVLRTLIPRCPSHIVQSMVRRGGQLRRERDAFQQYIGSPPPHAFERPPAIRAQPLVLFQTRIWMPGETGQDDAHEINEQRVAIVRALRRAFGRRFRGGIIPTAYARRHYPDALTSEPCTRADYVATLRQGLIGVYTRGLHHSLAFKFSEYLAASLCIVSPTIRNQLAVPLIAGEHYLPFETPEECVSACTRLLEDPELAAEYRRAAWQYYERAISPPALLLHCLGELERIQAAHAAEHFQVGSVEGRPRVAYGGAPYDVNADVTAVGGAVPPSA